MGLQASQHRVSQSWPKTASLAHPRCLCIQRELSGSQVHDLAPRPLGSGSQYSGLPMDLVTWLFPQPPFFIWYLRRFNKQIEVILICPGWTEARWLPQLATLRTKLSFLQIGGKVDRKSSWFLESIHELTKKASFGTTNPKVSPGDLNKAQSPNTF